MVKYSIYSLVQGNKVGAFIDMVSYMPKVSKINAGNVVVSDN